jgi:SAM-dependent methyltransferase
MQPTLGSVFRKRWQDARSRKSRYQSLKEIAADIGEFILDSTPQRHRARFGDLQYDWDHPGSNTTAGTVTARTRLLAAVSGAPYQPSEPALFEEMLRSLIIDFSQFTFVDIGSGKGRTLLMAAELGFRRVIGVELLPELHQVALSNIAASSYSNIESVCVDGRDYQFPPEPLVIYLFNPLPAAALSQTISNLQQSQERQPRPVKIIYHNPTSEDVLSRAPFLKKSHSSHQYAIYSN